MSTPSCANFNDASINQFTEDGTAWYTVVGSVLRQAVSTLGGDEVSEALRDDDMAQYWRSRARALSLWLQRYIDHHGLAYFIEQLVPLLIPRVDRLAAERVQQLSKLCAQCTAEHENIDHHPESLKDYLKQHPISSSEIQDDVVHCMTIHASKGLEFDLVLIPQLGFNLTEKDHRESVILDRPHPSAAPERNFPSTSE